MLLELEILKPLVILSDSEGSVNSAIAAWQILRYRSG